MRKKIISIILLILWAYLIFYLSDQPSYISSKMSSGMIKHAFFVNDVTLNLIHNPLRELMHTVVFLIFALLLINVLVKFGIKKVMLYCITISLIYALSDEIHQIYVPGRAFELLDIFLDFVGIMIANLLYFNFISCIGTDKVED